MSIRIYPTAAIADDIGAAAKARGKTITQYLIDLHSMNKNAKEGANDRIRAEQ